MSKEYHIKETKPATYTFKVYANSEKEALEKYHEHTDVEEIGLSHGGPMTRGLKVIEVGEASDHCSVCGLKYSPENVRDYRCKECK